MHSLYCADVPLINCSLTGHFLYKLPIPRHRPTSANHSRVFRLPSVR